MIGMHMTRIRAERGVAMITVLLVAAALTAVASVGTFATIREFGANQDDRASARALAVAEAGLDRYLAYIRSGQVTFNMMNQAGCAEPALPLPPGAIGGGTYTVSLTVYDPQATGASQFPPDACANRPANPNRGQSGEPGDKNTYFVITSEGTVPGAMRKIRQVVSAVPIGLPVGIYANSLTVQSQTHPIITTTMVSETTIQNRSKLQFSGLDPWYLMEDVYPGGIMPENPDPSNPDAWKTLPAPAAAHAAGTIYLNNASNPEFNRSSTNCTANPNAQSIWDSDGSQDSGPITTGCAAWPGSGPVGGGAGWHPKSSKFTTDMLASFASPRLSEEDYQTLKEAAKAYGVYCSFPGHGGTGLAECTVAGVPGASSDYKGHIAGLLTSGENNILAYFEFRSGTPAQNNLGNLGTVWGCNDDPDLNKSLVAIVRNGGINVTGAAGDKINGALIMDGNWASVGSFELNGSLVSQGNVHLHSSSQNYYVNDCWVKNLPGAYFKPVTGHWTEVDR